MRSDMYKVIVERPRNYKGKYSVAARWRDDLDGPRQLGMRAGYGGPYLNENLAPLQRFLLAQVGRPWNKVYSEISAGIDRRNTVQQHIYAHLEDMIATQVEWRDGRWLDLQDRSRHFRTFESLRQPLYVDPRTGLIRSNNQYRRWKVVRDAQRAREAAEIAARRRVIDDTMQLMLLEGQWYEVRLARLPPLYVVEKVIDGKVWRSWKSDGVYDVVLRCTVRRHDHEHTDRQHFLYGGPNPHSARDVYAVSKRQLSRREMLGAGLCRPC